MTTDPHPDCPPSVPPLHATAVVLDAPRTLELRSLPISPPGEADLVVDIGWTGVSAGTERLLFTGEMPPFPGMGYPLVPGYESVGTVVAAGPAAGHAIGDCVFVPGSACFGEVRGLFGGAASRLVVPGERVVRIDPALGEKGVLLALAATAHHAVSAPGARLPELIVGNGVLGRLLARVTRALDPSMEPVIWERQEARIDSLDGTSVLHPDEDARSDYASIYDASGDHKLLDELIGRLAPRGEVVLAGFYRMPLSFSFPPAFMREARIRVSAEWAHDSLAAVSRLIAEGLLSLDGLITHRMAATDAVDAYETAFGDPTCLKLVLDWSDTA